MLALNKNLQKLVDIAQKPSKLAVGLMSGTSLDGLDIALCRFTGHGLETKFELLNFVTVPYDEVFKTEVRAVFAKAEASLEKVCLLNEYIGSLHADLILQALKQWNVEYSSVDFIASHGQTIYHAPKRLHHQKNYLNATLQIGDGDHIAVKTGILTISDFRQKHIAAGGEGAPLALYGDVLLGSKPGENRLLLNIGGIANLTFLPADGDNSKIICTDIGPGNTLIDAATKTLFNQPFDEDSKAAFAGVINQDLLSALLSIPFFKEPAPKTTGPELFNLKYVKQAQAKSLTVIIEPNDLVATLSALTGKTIADYITHNFPADDLKLFVSGGGARNLFIMDYLKQNLPKAIISDTSVLGIDPDAKEAILFALLGNEALCGDSINIGSNPDVLMGKFSFPL